MTTQPNNDPSKLEGEVLKSHEEFEEWWNDGLESWGYDPNYKKYTSSAWNHQQSKIDALTKERDELREYCNELFKKIQSMCEHTTVLDSRPPYCAICHKELD